MKEVQIFLNFSVGQWFCKLKTSLVIIIMYLYMNFTVFLLLQGYIYIWNLF